MSTSTRPRRSDATRAAILDAARRRFAADGYERATIRAIAKDASIDASMVMRYYGNKEALFAAASEFDLQIPDLTEIPREELGRAMVSHFLQRWDDDTSLVALLRASVTNATVAERLRNLLETQLRPAVAQISSEQSATQRAVLISSQMLGVALTRYVLCLKPAVDLPRSEIVDWLGPTLQRYLTAETP